MYKKSLFCLQTNLTNNYNLYDDFVNICNQKSIHNIDERFEELVLTDYTSFNNFINLYKNNTFKAFPENEWFTIQSLYNNQISDEFINVLCNSRGHGIGSGEYLGIFFLKEGLKRVSNREGKGDIYNGKTIIEVKGNHGRIGVDEMDVRPIYQNLIKVIPNFKQNINELKNKGTITINVNHKNKMKKSWFLSVLYNENNIDINIFKQNFIKGMIECHPLYDPNFDDLSFIDKMFYIDEENKISIDNNNKGWLKFELMYYKRVYNFDQMMLVNDDNKIYLSSLDTDKNIEKFLEQTNICKYPTITWFVGREDHRFMIGI